MADSNFGSVVLLLKGEGTNGSTTFVDSSFPAKTLTVYGAAQISTAQSKFGSASIFNNSGRITASNAAFAPGTGDFTIELFAYPTSFAGYQSLFGSRTTSVSSTTAFSLGVSTSGNAYLYSDSFIVQSPGPLSTNAQQHIAVTRSSGTVRLFIGGTLVASATNTQNFTTSLFNIGADGDGTEAYTGYLDEVRYTVGVARYTASFTPPTTEFDASFFATAALSAPAGYVFSSTNNLSAPSGTVFSFGGASANLVNPMQEALGYGGASVALIGTSPTFYADGHNSTGENAFAGTAPTASLVFAGGANAKLIAPRPVLAITGAFSGFGTADLTAPAPSLSATGVVSATASADLIAPMASLVGYSGAVCSITLTGKSTVTASGTSGFIGGTVITCPLFKLTASATRQTNGSADLLAPSPRMGATAQAWLIAPGATLTAIGTAVVTAAYEAYSVNLKHKVRMQGEQPAIDEMTHYTNFPFDRIVRYQNSYFGVAADGLYLLEGTTDDGAAIACTLETHISDFDIPEKKTIVSARIGGRFGPTSTVTLHVGETGQTAYSYTTPRGQLAQNHREKFGRGIKDRYFGLEVATTGALEIDQLELEINKLTRRI